MALAPDTGYCAVTFSLSKTVTPIDASTAAAVRGRGCRVQSKATMFKKRSILD
jgi:hypothetical protein